MATHDCVPRPFHTGGIDTVERDLQVAGAGYATERIGGVTADQVGLLHRGQGERLVCGGRIGGDTDGRVVLSEELQDRGFIVCQLLP